jgi:hypothetical protein
MPGRKVGKTVSISSKVAAGRLVRLTNAVLEDLVLSASHSGDGIRRR